MKSFSPNAHCPCGSGLKYKKCCRPYHRGRSAPDALTLMKSRYSAYAVGEIDYIVTTTHPSSPEFDPDTDRWKASIYAFCRATEFLKLTILEYEPGDEEAFVTFRATLSSGNLTEKSRFLNVEGRWLYRSGTFLP